MLRPSSTTKGSIRLWRREQPRGRHPMPEGRGEVLTSDSGAEAFLRSLSISVPRFLPPIWTSAPSPLPAATLWAALSASQFISRPVGDACRSAESWPGHSLRGRRGALSSAETRTVRAASPGPCRTEAASRVEGAASGTTSIWGHVRGARHRCQRPGGLPSFLPPSLSPAGNWPSPSEHLASGLVSCLPAPRPRNFAK